MDTMTTVATWNPDHQREYWIPVDTVKLDEFKRAIREWLTTTYASRPQPPAGLPAHIRIDHLVDDPEDAAVVDAMMRWAGSRASKGGGATTEAGEG